MVLRDLEVRSSPFGSYRVRGRETSRLENFSDAVFGFSATLLVVSLEVPRTFAELAANLKGFAAFGLSFLALVLIWSAHNGFFRRYGLSDWLTSALNAVLLFVVLFFVYPLKFLTVSFLAFVVGIDASGVPGGVNEQMYSSEGEVRMLFVIYGLGFVAVFTCFALLYRHALGLRRRLELEPIEVFDARTMVYFYLVLAGMGAISVTLSLTGVGSRWGGVGGWIYSFLGPICWLYGHLRAKRREALEKADG